MTHDVAEAPGTALALLGERALVATEVFRPGGVRIILDQIKASVAKEEIDISTPEGRRACASLAYKVARSKTALDAMGKSLTDQWRKQAESVHAERRLIEKELDCSRHRHRAGANARSKPRFHREYRQGGHRGDREGRNPALPHGVLSNGP